MRTVLLTGGTGAIGSVLARYLLAEPETHVCLLLRAQSTTHLEERLKELNRFWGFGVDAQPRAGSLHAVAGDVTRPDLGMEPATYARLATEVTHIIHSAGNVKLNRSLDEARRSAVESAGHVVSFAEACQRRGQLQKVEFVSTVGVAGSLAGTVPERALREVRTFRNTYEAAKAEAETFLLDRIDAGLPATIHRPSMVVGDSGDGRIIQFQVFYYLCEFLSGRRTGGIVPDVGETQLDIIPVDYVARAIQRSSQRPDAIGRIFHLCAGPQQAPRLVDLTQRVRAFFASRGLTVPTLRQVPVALMRALLPLAGRVVSPRTRRAIESLPHFLAYLDVNQTFANVRTSEFFAADGLSVPPIDAYLDAVLSYYVARQSESGGRAAQGVA